MSQPPETHDQVGHFWCPLLGQPLHFGYCRRSQDGLPCHRIITCYEPHFAVRQFLEDHYTPEELARCLAPPPSRLDRLAQALAQSQGDKPQGEKP